MHPLPGPREDNAMKKGFAAIIFVSWLLLATGCAGPGTYEPAIRPQSPPYSGMGVPPSYYNNDPGLEEWFTPPYFNPYVGN